MRVAVSLESVVVERAKPKMAHRPVAVFNRACRRTKIASGDERIAVKALTPVMSGTETSRRYWTATVIDRAASTLIPATVSWMQARGFDRPVAPQVRIVLPANVMGDNRLLTAIDRAGAGSVRITGH